MWTRRAAPTAAPTSPAHTDRPGINRLRDLDSPSSEQLRGVFRYEQEHTGGTVHIDTKKLGRIPAGGGWRTHGMGTEAARASKRTAPGTGRVSYTYLYSAFDDHSWLAYTEALNDEEAVSAVAFWHRAVALFVAHCVTMIRRDLIDNGACYRSITRASALTATATTYQAHTPLTNEKVDRYQGTLAREGACVCDYSSEQEHRFMLAVFMNYYDHGRSHAALGGRSSTSRTTRDRLLPRLGPGTRTDRGRPTTTRLPRPWCNPETRHLAHVMRISLSIVERSQYRCVPPQSLRSNNRTVS